MNGYYEIFIFLSGLEIPICIYHRAFFNYGNMLTHMFVPKHCMNNHGSATGLGKILKFKWKWCCRKSREYPVSALTIIVHFIKWSLVMFTNISYSFCQFLAFTNDLSQNSDILFYNNVFGILYRWKIWKDSYMLKERELKNYKKNFKKFWLIVNITKVCYTCTLYI